MACSTMRSSLEDNPQVEIIEWPGLPMPGWLAMIDVRPAYGDGR